MISLRLELSGKKSACAQMNMMDVMNLMNKFWNNYSDKICLHMQNPSPPSRLVYEVSFERGEFPRNSREPCAESIIGLSDCLTDHDTSHRGRR